MTAAYQLTSGTSIMRIVDQTLIPADNNNVDYRAYEAWLAAGNTPDPITPPTASEAAQTASAASLAAGITITSTGTPAVNGTYSLSPNSLDLIVETSTTINTNGEFPGGITQLPWADVNGTEHLFPSVAVFKEFALAVSAYVGQIEIYANSGGTTGSLPTTNAVTIA